MYAHHRDALRAALRGTYGIDLSHPGLPLQELADLVAWLPGGSVLWQATGGPLARSREEQALLLVDLHIRQYMWLRSGKKGREPKYPPHPPLASERRQENAVMARKAAAYARRQERLHRGQE